jgi:hypothetical protein
LAVQVVHGLRRKKSSGGLEMIAAQELLAKLEFPSTPK